MMDKRVRICIDSSLAFLAPLSYNQHRNAIGKECSAIMAEILNVPEIFGSDVFNEAVMKQRLPMEVYKAWENCIQTGSTLPLNVANEIAEAM